MRSWERLPVPLLHPCSARAKERRHRLRHPMFAQRSQVQFLDNGAIRGNALLDLDHGSVQGFWLANVQVEESWPILVADACNVGKALRGEEGGRRALALEKRVRAERGTEPNVDRSDRIASAQIQRLANGEDGRRIACVELEIRAHLADRSIVVAPTESK